VREVDFDTVIRQGVELQQWFPSANLVAVGGTAAAIHCEHRFSLDVDCVTSDLQARYDEFSSHLDNWPGWKTNRKNPPVLILGERDHIELGLRQLRRTVPLRTVRLRNLVVPTLAETLRIKAFLLTQRRATRDYVDLSALLQKTGEAISLECLAYLNLVYPTKDNQTIVTRLAEACEATPIDFNAINLKNYKGLIKPFNEWDFVRETCRAVSRKLLKNELAECLPKILPVGFE
jgi:hypothetical protein